MPPSVVYVLPTSELYGGVRVILEHADGLLARGYAVRVVGPDPAPDWYPLRSPYTQVDLFAPGGVPAADLCVGTFWTTVGPAYTSGSRHVFHLCQGYEGVHREYAPILPQIDAAYRLPIPKLLISAHLEPVLVERYGCRCHLLGQAVDAALFLPGEGFREEPEPLRVGIVGPFGVRSKGIREALTGLRLARQQGMSLEVHRASADPLEDAERDLGMTDRFFHRLDTRGMVGFYQGLDAYVHPSYDEEGYPLPPLEAMACGVPVALSRIRPFAVIPDAAVERFPPGEPEALVPALAALRGPHRRRQLRAAGLAYSRSMTLDKVLDRLEAAFASEGAPVVSAP